MKNLNFQSPKPKRAKGKILPASFSTQLLRERLDLSKSRANRLPFIFITSQHLQKQLTIHQWRNKTQFPIVKVEKCTLAGKKSEMLKLEVQTEPIVTRLANLSQLPLFQILYLLKESLIALERLYHKFGPFHLTPNMVAINQNMKCKVWVNQRFESNQFIKTFMSEPQFLTILFCMFQQKCKITKNTTSFFDSIRLCKSFCQALSFAQNYIKSHKIKLVNSFSIQSQEDSSQQRRRVNLRSISPFNKSPKFLEDKKFRISLRSIDQLRRIPFIIKNFINLKQSSAKTTNIYKKNSYNTSIRQTLTSQGLRTADSDTHKYLKTTIMKSEFHIKITPPRITNSLERKLTSSIQTNKVVHSCSVSNKHTFFNKNTLKKPSVKHILGHITDEQDEQSTKAKQNEVYSQNQWQKTFSLVSDDSNLKESVHISTDKKLAQYSELKLNLLQKIQTETCESFIKRSNQSIQPSLRVPQTCQP